MSLRRVALGQTGENARREKTSDPVAGRDQLRGSEGVGMICKKVERIGEHLRPRLQALRGVQLDIFEQVRSGTRDP